jgi:hypothetical protein
MNEYWELDYSNNFVEDDKATAIYKDDPDWVFAVFYQRMFNNAESSGIIEQCTPYCHLWDRMYVKERRKIYHAFFNSYSDRVRLK